jgi:hypothetical protein
VASDRKGKLRFGRRESVGVSMNEIRPGAIMQARIQIGSSMRVRPVEIAAVRDGRALVRRISPSEKEAHAAMRAREITFNRERCWVLDKLELLPITSLLSVEQHAPGYVDEAV